MGKGCMEAYDTEKYTWVQIERILRVAFECADVRRKKICVVDKADVLESSRLWREVVSETSVLETSVSDNQNGFSNIEIEYLNIEKAAKQLIVDPSQFDVIVTSNMFGEILGGVLAALTETDSIRYSSNIK